MNPRPWLRAGLVAGVFCLAVAAALAVNHARRPDPLHDPALAALRRELAERPNDAALKQRIRDRDADLRGEWFGRQAFARRGIWLLLGGAAVAVGCLVVTRSLGARPFDPRGQARLRPWERAALGGGGALLGGVALLGGLALLGGAAPPAAAPAASTALPPEPDPGERARQWPGFRGPAAGVAAGPAPLSWDAASGAGIRWRSAVPLPGVGSPAVWGDAVYLSGATASEQALMAFDLASGALRWRCPLPVPAGARGEVFPDTGLAAPTPVTDGRLVVALFGSGTLAAVEPGGRLRWSRHLGAADSQYGLAASPCLWRDRVIVQFDQGGDDEGRSALLAFDLASGRELWRAKRPVGASWASPVVAELAGQPRILTCAKPWVIAYDPADGRECWRAEVLGGEVAASPAVADGLVVVANAGARLAALRADGSSAWTQDDGDLPDTASPVAHAGLAAMVGPSGTVTCVDLASGAKQWDHAFEGATFRASPLVAGGRLYLIDDSGRAQVLSWDRAFAALGGGTLGEAVSATPAVAGGLLLVRGQQHLFCIGAAP